MATPNQLPIRLSFGPFEIDSSSGELFRRGIRVHLPGQPFAILVLLLERPGEVFTREQLRERIWGEGTFVDFEHGLNAAMNKLRRGLGDSAEHPRYIETVAGRGYRFIGTLASGKAEITPVLPIPEVRQQRRRRWGRVSLWERLAWAVGALVCLGAGMRWLRAPDGLPDWTLTAVTSNAGLSAFPALSPDGTLIAFSSDRGLNGEQDLYIRQVAGGQPVRLTFDGAGNTAPNFSPDGTKIVFQSQRQGGGIYEVPALGGPVKLLAKGGLDPKYSPDGSQVAYWVGTEAVSTGVPGSGSIWVLPVTGGAPRRIAPQFSAARQPLWLPDGKHLLFLGYRSNQAFVNSAIDWWTVATDSGSETETGLHEAMRLAGLQPEISSRALRPPSLPSPGCWSQTTNTVVFSFRRDLWEIGVSPQSGKVSGRFNRLTAGTLNALHPSCTNTGAVAFTSMDIRTDVWLLPFDLDHGTPRGTLARVTADPAARGHASLSKDGRLVAFASNQSGQNNIWVRDLATGEESAVAPSSLAQQYPASNAAGDKIAFSTFEKDDRAVFVSAPGGPAERVCVGCLRATDWSKEGKTMLVFAGNPYQIDVLDIATGSRTPILKQPNYNLLYGRFSPDGRWVSFTVRTQPDRARIAIAPLDGPKPVPESAWITVSEESPGDWADWSPDGNTLYFSSRRDGRSCLWGQRVERLSHRPLGEPFVALHLHGRVYYRPGSAEGGWSTAPGRIAMLLAEANGNIWMMSRQHPNEKERSATSLSRDASGGKPTGGLEPR